MNTGDLTKFSYKKGSGDKKDSGSLSRPDIHMLSTRLSIA